MSKKQQRGSWVMTLIIIAIFIFAGVFYIKTSHPGIYEKAISYITDAADQKQTLETVSEQVYDSVKVPGNMLSEVQFDYLSSYSAVRVSVPLDDAVVTSDFGTRTDPVTGKASATHHGIDLAAKEGSKIHCYKDGTVVYTDVDPVYGNCVEISHGDISSFYAHMSCVTVSAGDSISAGDTVGIIGSTGKSTGTHLHFEIRKDGQCLDPADYLYDKI